MPEGTGGYICTSVLDVKNALKTDRTFVFDVVPLGASPRPTPLKLSYAGLIEPDVDATLEALLVASPSGKVSVEWHPTSSK